MMPPRHVSLGRIAVHRTGYTWAPAGLYVALLYLIYQYGANSTNANPRWLNSLTP